jgi:hypothetical protein
MDFLQQERSNTRLPGITVPSALRGRWVCSLLLSPLEWLVENLPEWTSIVWPCRSASFSLLPWSFCVFGAAALDGAGPRPTTHEFRVAEPDISVRFASSIWRGSRKKADTMARYPSGKGGASKLEAADELVAVVKRYFN